MKVLLPLENMAIEVKGIKTVGHLLNQFSLKEEEVLVINTRESRLITHDENLEEEMEIKIVKVISGG